ncbi:MAG: helix-turn-helix domain-containing protein, partial [Candidatus Krumholzibacteriia bacterium]
LVSATPSGDIVRGRVPMGLSAAVGSGEGFDAASTADLLSLDDLKVVIPGVERLVIDRVLRRTKGNQSKAARVLNLSRGALIAKMKEYELADYRYLRRKRR